MIDSVLGSSAKDWKGERGEVKGSRPEESGGHPTRVGKGNRDIYKGIKGEGNVVAPSACPARTGLDGLDPNRRQQGDDQVGGWRDGKRSNHNQRWFVVRR